jgi:hypothetical protein
MPSAPNDQSLKQYCQRQSNEYNNDKTTDLGITEIPAADVQSAVLISRRNDQWNRQ